MKITKDMKNVRYINEIRVRIQETNSQICNIEKSALALTRTLRARILHLDEEAQKFYKKYGDKYDETN
jgi:hypothetical protein